MAKYDFVCEKCKTQEERNVPMAERETQVCDCGRGLIAMFSPPTTFYIPRSFRVSFSDLFGTSSEKEYLKENPNLERINQSTFRSRKDQDQSRWDKARRDSADVERALIANGTLTEPISTGSSMGPHKYEEAFKGE